MSDSSFYSELKAGEDEAWLGHKYTDRTMFGVTGSEQQYWVGFQTAWEIQDFLFSNIKLYGRMWDVSRIPIFNKERNDYNLGLAPEVTQGNIGDCTIIASMSALSTKPEQI